MDSSSKKTWDFAKKHEGKKAAKASKKIARKLGIKSGHQKDGGWIGKDALGGSHSNFHYGKQ